MLFINKKLLFSLPVLLLLLGLVKSNQLDMDELNRYLAKKLDIVSNLTLRQPRDILDEGELKSGTALIVYFGDFSSEEVSTFQSSLSLLALLPRYAKTGTDLKVGFVDTSTQNGDQLRLRLDVGMRHSIVAWTKQRRATFHGYRNVQLLLDFVDRLILSKPGWLTYKDQRNEESVVLLLPDGVERPTADWMVQLSEISVQMPAFTGAGRRLASSYGAVPGSLVYRSPVTGSVASVRLNEHRGRSLHWLLRQIRSGDSVMQLDARSLYLPAAEAQHWESEEASSARSNDARTLPGKPLLILLADPESQPTASIALSLMKRLVSIRRREQQQKQQQPQPQQQKGPPWLSAVLNPWRKFAGEPEINWADLLGEPALDRGPAFLMTTNRRFGGADKIVPGDAFYLDGFRLVEGGAEQEAAAHQTVLMALRRWLRGWLEAREAKAQTGSLRAADEL